MLEEKNQLAHLRAALRSEPGCLSVNIAAAPLIERYFQELLHFADRLARASRRRLVLDGADLALDAWHTILQRLASEAGEVLTNEAYFRNLLYRIVRTRFLDTIEKEQNRDEVELDADESVNEALLEKEGAEGDLFFGDRGRFLPIIAALFQGEDVLKETVRRLPRRRLKYYRALVLVHLGEFFRREVSSSYGEQARLFRRYVELLEIPRALWEPVEDQALHSEGLEDLLKTANQLCDTNIKDRAMLSVLRYELNQLTG